MTRSRKLTAIVLCLLPVLCGLTIAQCRGLQSSDFVKICENGFDAEDQAEDINDYPWSMEYFVPEGKATGHVYVGMGCRVANFTSGAAVALFFGNDPINFSRIRPPEIRRYRPDLGPTTWEKVFDYRDVETGVPFYRTIGFRNMAIHDGYLYAGTWGLKPSIWRSATGDPGTWEKVLELNAVGSIRSMVSHNGLLYFSSTEDLDVLGAALAKIWATDGVDFWPIIDDGFGDSMNKGVANLTSFNGYLWAGTANQEGYEVWKLEGPDKDVGPQLVVDNGGPDPRNEIAGTLFPFNNKLYVGSLILLGINPLSGNGIKGADMIRIDTNDTWETIVGQNSLSGYDSGFNHFTNAYLWFMEQHDGWLYCGTWDQATLWRGVVQDPAAFIDAVIAFFETYGGDATKREPDAYDYLVHNGADLYKSPDGVQWEPVFIDGLGNANNQGVRSMTSDGEYLYVGLTNPTDGLEVWRGKAPE